jgi:hypothetical protein
MRRARVSTGVVLLVGVVLMVLVVGPASARKPSAGPPQWFTTQVLADGTAFRSSLDGVTARHADTEPGTYFVTFPFALLGCEFLTTPLDGPNFVVPFASYRYAGPDNEVMVKVFDAGGTQADASFELGVVCHSLA